VEQLERTVEVLRKSKRAENCDFSEGGPSKSLQSPATTERRRPTSAPTHVTATGAASRHAPSNQQQRPRSTVPAPFRSMELAEMKWLERRERERQERDAKRREEEEAASAERERFARSVRSGRPFEGVIDRSERMLTRRRMKEEKAELELSAALSANKFKAQPAVILDQDWHAIEEKDRIRRAQRVEMRKAQLLRMSSMPKRMAAHEVGKRARSTEVNHGRVSPRSSKVAPSSDQRTRTLSPEKVREQLERRQKQWDKRMAAAKRAPSATVPPSLPLEEREREYRSKAAARAAARNERERREKEQAKEEMRRDRERLMNMPVPSAPRTTYSAMLKAQGVREKLEAARAAQERTAKLDMHRAKQHKEFSSIVTEALKGAERNRAGEITSVSSAARAAAAGMKFKEALKENKERIRAVQKNRPTLWERHDLELRKEAAKREALTSIARSVYGGAHGWEKAAVKDALFDEEEQAILGI
jgi:hypothetical protein